MRVQLRQAVIYTRQKLDISERCACAVLDVARSSLRYQTKSVDDTELRLAMIQYKMLTVLDEYASEALCTHRL